MNKQKRISQFGGLSRKAATLFPLLILYALLSALSSCTARHVEETVTTDAHRSSALPVKAETPITAQPNLPARDPDIEAAGDRVAEAFTYLNTHHREAALRALMQAEAPLNRAMQRAKSSSEQSRVKMHQVLRDYEMAERALQRNAPDAGKQLAMLDKTLDRLDLDTDK
jgi:hypothetical protein